MVSEKKVPTEDCDKAAVKVYNARKAYNSFMDSNTVMKEMQDDPAWSTDFKYGITKAG